MIISSASVDALGDKFIQDLEAIASSLIGYCGLPHAKEVGYLSEALLRWMDFRLRFVEPKPRKVFYSNRFPKKLPKAVRRALKAFENANLAGDDINRFQGKGLTKHHDVSGSKPAKRTDHLWADWNIHHFHLVPLSEDNGTYYSERSGWLLFAMVIGDEIAFIDVTEHGKGALENQKLFEIFVRSWPEAAESSRLKGLLPSTTRRTAEEVRQLRTVGVSSPLVVDGAVYMPGAGGITAASTSLRGTMARNDIVRGARDLARIVLDASNPLIPEINASDATGTDLCLALTPKGIAIFGKPHDTCWLVPRAQGVWANSTVGRMSDLMLPEWLGKKIHDAHEAGALPIVR